MPDDVVDAPLEVDRESLLELARGANLYPSRFAFLRELIQNAVDATLLRVFAEHGADAFPTHEGSMRDLRARLAAFPIDVDIERVAGDERSIERRYCVSVTDRGLGIRRSDLPHLQRIGSSRKNPDRAAMIAAMPEWMQPSGTFGIGLQSVFQVADTLRLSTRHADGTALEIELSTRDGGRVRVTEGTRAEVGTRVEVTLELRVEERDRWTGAPPEVLREVDPLVDSVDGALLGATEQVRTLAAASAATVRVAGKPVEGAWSGEAIFDPRTLVEVALPGDGVEAADPANPHERAWPYWSRASPHHYRGAPVEWSTYPLEGVRWRSNCHFGSARELLLVGRDKWSLPGLRVVTERVETTLRAHVPALVPTLDPRGRAVVHYAAFLLGEGMEPGTDAWRRRKIVVIGDSRREGTISLGELADAPYLEWRDESNEQDFAFPSGEVIGAIAHDVASVRLFPGARHEAGVLRITRDEELHVDDLSAEKALRGERLLKRIHHVRLWVMLPDDYRRLRGTPERERNLLSGLRAPTNMGPWVVRDGVVTTPALDALVRWTAESRGEGPEACAEIAATWARYLARFDPVLRERTDLRFDYALEDTLAELARIAAAPSTE